MKRYILSRWIVYPHRLFSVHWIGHVSQSCPWDEPIARIIARRPRLAGGGMNGHLEASRGVVDQHLLALSRIAIRLHPASSPPLAAD
jgi:hypothetical protein